MPTTEEIDLELFENERDVGALRRHSRKLLGEIRKLKDKVRDLEGKPRAKREDEMTPRERFFADAQKRLAGLEGEAHAAELAKLEQELEPLIAAEIDEHRRQSEAQIASLKGAIVSATREQQARTLLKDLARPGCAEVLLPHVLARIGVETRGEELVTVVNDAQGKPSALTIDALKDELRADPTLRALVIGSTAEEQAAHAARVKAATSPPVIH